jgi:hypothetical protein
LPIPRVAGETKQVRRAAAVRTTEAEDLLLGQAGDLPGQRALQALSASEGQGPQQPYPGIMEQIVDVPAQAFFGAMMPGEACHQAAHGGAGVYIIS